MIDFTNSQIEQFSVHYVGNKGNGEEVQLSEHPVELTDLRIREVVLRYVVQTFKLEEFYSFSFSTGEITLNPLYNFCQRIFRQSKNFHKGSQDMARHLFNQSLHPNIRPGEFFIIRFSGIMLNGERTSAIGLFKSENKHPFLKVIPENKEFSIDLDEGINMDKMDKGCLIFDINEAEGFQLLIVDKLSKGTEAKFWKDDFLNVLPLNDNYHATKIVLDIAKKYVSGPLGEQYEVTKADQVDMLNRSLEYFRNNEQYNKKGFEKEVIQDPGMIRSFRKFEESCREELQVGDIDHFEISDSAVRRQQRFFKSVIKLDKNFHIYIHGNRELIEQGIDHKTGKRFYKLYFDEEH